MTRTAIITLFTTILLFSSMIVFPLGSINDLDSDGNDVSLYSVEESEKPNNTIFHSGMNDENKKDQEQFEGPGLDTNQGQTLDPEMELGNVRAETGKTNLPGTSTFLKGSVNQRITGTTVWTQSQPEDLFEEDVVIRTGTDSYCQFNFGNKLYLLLSPGSEITCDLSHQMGDSVLMEFTITHGNAAFYCEFGNNGSSFSLFYPNEDKVIVDHPESTVFHSNVDGLVRVFEGFLIYEEKSESPSIEDRHLIQEGRDSNWNEVPNTQIQYSLPLISSTISGTGQEMIGFIDDEYTQVGMEDAFLFRLMDSDLFCSWRDDGTPFYLNLGIPGPGLYNVSYLLSSPEVHGFEFTDLRSYSTSQIHFSFYPDAVYLSVGNGFTYNLSITGTTKETFILRDMTIPKVQGQWFQIIRDDKLSSESYGSVIFALDEDGDGSLDESVALRSGGDGDDAYDELYRERTEPTFVTMFLMLFLLFIVIGLFMFHGGYLEEMGFIFKSPLPAIIDLFDGDETDEQEIEKDDVPQEVVEADEVIQADEEEEVVVVPVEVVDEIEDQEEIAVEVEEEEATPESMAEDFVELKKSRVLEEEYDQLDEDGKVKEIEEPVPIVDIHDETAADIQKEPADVDGSEEEEIPEDDIPEEEPEPADDQETEPMTEEDISKEEPEFDEEIATPDETVEEETSVEDEDEEIPLSEEQDELTEEPIEEESEETSLEDEDEEIPLSEEQDGPTEEPVKEEPNDLDIPFVEQDDEADQIPERPLAEESEIKDQEEETLEHVVDEIIGERDLDPEEKEMDFSEPETPIKVQTIGTTEMEPGLHDDEVDEPAIEDSERFPDTPEDVTEDYDLLPDEEGKRPETFPAMFETISKGEPEPIPEELEATPELHDISDVVPSQPDSMVSEPPGPESGLESEPEPEDTDPSTMGEVDGEMDTISSVDDTSGETDELLSEPGSESAEEADDATLIAGIIKEDFERIDNEPEAPKRKKKWYKPHGKWTQANIDLGLIIVGKMREELDFLTLDNTQEERWVAKEDRWMTDEEWWDHEVERMKNWDSVIQDSITNLDRID